MHDDGNILVSASAGSGKTHTMIERVKRLVLEKNVNVGQILCVTFTEKAASEMKEKLKSALCYNGAFFAIMMAKRILKCHTHYHSQEQKLI